MRNHNSDPIQDFKIEHRLEELKEVPVRNPLRAASGRARFLREAGEYRQAVSPWMQVRQKGWTFPIRKEKLSMNALVSLILVATLLLGGGGATVAAAQDDLPNQSLYQLKLWAENATLALNGDPQEQAVLLMTMAQTRTQEMVALAEKGITPPDQVRERLEQHIRQTLQLAANMDDAGCEKTLLQLRERLQVQERVMEQLLTHANPETEPLLRQTRLMLQTHLQLADQGLADLQGFQYRIENQMQYGQDEEAIPEPNQQGEPGFHQNGPEGQPAGDPGAGVENGNDTPGEPNPDRPQSGNDGKSSGDESNGGSNQDNSQGGNDSGSDSNGGNGSGSGSDGGGGGGNK